MAERTEQYFVDLYDLLHRLSLEEQEIHGHHGSLPYAFHPAFLGSSLFLLSGLLGPAAFLGVNIPRSTKSRLGYEFYRKMLAEREPAALSRTLDEISTEWSVNAAQLVLQGSMAYASAEQFPQRVKRFIPVDLYSPEWSPTDTASVSLALQDFVESLGFKYVSHPSVLRSSTHARGAIETRPMTVDELRQTELLLHTALGALNSSQSQAVVVKADELKELEAQKAIAEIQKLQAETMKAHAEAGKNVAETEKIHAETRKVKAETVSASVEALGKLGTAILKASVGISVLIGTTSISAGHADLPHKQTVVEKVPCSENFKQLSKFLEKVCEPEEPFKTFSRSSGR